MPQLSYIYLLFHSHLTFLCIFYFAIDFTEFIEFTEFVEFIEFVQLL